MSDADSRLNDAADRAEAGADIIEQVANGGDAVEVPTASGPRPSLAKWFADRYAEFYAWAALILADCLEALGLAQAVLADTVAAKAGAESAQAGAVAARDAALLSRGLWQTTAQGIGNGVAGTASLVAGSGGTNGTFALAFSGGTQVIAPKGYFVVAGGLVTQVVITYAGHYSAGVPSLSFVASAGLTGASATAVMGANTPVDAYFSVPQSGSNDFLVLYRVDTGPVATEITRYPSSAASEALRISDEFGTKRRRYMEQLADAGSLLPKAAVVVLLGQSLNVPRGTIVQAKSAPNAKMLVGGAATASWQFNAIDATFMGHWDDLASVVDFEERTGQTPMAGVVNTLAGSRYKQIYIGSTAIWARTLEVLSTTGPQTNTQAMLLRLCALARADGYDPEVYFYTAHGEANAATNTSENDYYDLGVRYYGRNQLYAAQAMQKPGYYAPIIFTYPVQMSNGDDGARDRNIKAAIKRLAIDLPNGINLGSIYQWPCGTDRVHPTEGGSVQRGEAVGAAIRDYADKGIKWGGLRIVDVTLNGSTFVAQFNSPVVRDATINAGQNLNTALAEDGFEWIDNGTQIAISSVAYEGYKVRGTLASTPVGTIDQQVLRIAEQTTTRTFTVGANNLSGSVVRMVGDGWQSPYDYTYTNYTWAEMQRFNQVRAI